MGCFQQGSPASTATIHPPPFARRKRTWFPEKKFAPCHYWPCLFITTQCKPHLVSHSSPHFTTLFTTLHHTSPHFSLHFGTLVTTFHHTFHYSSPHFPLQFGTLFTTFHHTFHYSSVDFCNLLNHWWFSRVMVWRTEHFWPEDVTVAADDRHALPGQVE